VAFGIEENSQQTTQHYTDALDRVTQVVAPKGWVQSSYSSLTNSDVYSGLQDTQPSVACTSCTHVTNVADVFGTFASSTLQSDPDGAVTTSTTYDVAGDVLSASNPTRSGTTTTSTNSYDVIYRPTQSLNPDNSVAQIFYDSSVSTAGGAATQLCPATTYGLGAPVLGVDELGRKSQIWHDAQGNVIEADEPDDANALTVPTCYQYNTAGNLVGLAQGSLTRSYQYDPLGRTTQITTPESGVVTLAYTNDDGTLCSGDSSDVCKRTDARGVITRYKYDADNRLTQQTYSDGTPTAVFNYGESSALGVTLANTQGRLSSINTQDAKGKIISGQVFSYDGAGNIIDNSQCTPQNCGSSVFANTYTPDQMGNEINFSNNWGRSISVALNNAAQPTSVSVSAPDVNHPGTVFSKGRYNANGSRTLAILGNGLTEADGYSDTRYWLNSIRLTGGVATSGPSNIATPGAATFSVAGALKTVSTGSYPGIGTLDISGSLRQTAGSQSAAPSTGSIIISGAEQEKDTIIVPAVAGEGSVSVGGAAQSKQVTVPAVPSTGTFNIAGTLQSKPAVPAVPGSGSVAIAGNEQSAVVGATPATRSTGSVTISSNTGERCDVSDTGTICQNGTVSISFNNGAETDTVSYGSGDSTTTVAAKLASAINNCGLSTCYATASSSGATVNFTSTATGTGANWAVSTSYNAPAPSPFWWTGTVQTPNSKTGAPGCLSSVLFSGQNLFPGQCLNSPNGRFVLSLQTDGNLVLYDDTPDPNPWIPLWSTGTSGRGVDHGYMQSEGNFVLYAGTTAVWSSPYSSVNAYYLVVQDDGNLVIYTQFPGWSFTIGPAQETMNGGSNGNPGTTVYDHGTCTVYINGTPYSQPFGQGDTPNSIASGLVSSINKGNLASAPTPTSPSGTINLTADSGGPATNYPLSSSCSYDSSHFSNPSFTTSPSGANLTGGKDGIPAILDSGTVTLTVNSTFNASACYGPSGHCSVIDASCGTGDSTAAQMACILASSQNPNGLQRSGSPVAVTQVSGTGITLSAPDGSNFSLSSSTSYDNADFSAPSFSSSPSTMTGGMKAYPKTLYDSGTLSLKVGSYTASTPYGQFWASQSTGGGFAIGTQFSSFSLPGTPTSSRVFYGNGANGHVHERFTATDGSWKDQDLTSLSADPSGAGVGPLTSFAAPNTNAPEHVFYPGVIELYSDTSGAWHRRNITAMAGATQSNYLELTSFLSQDPNAPEHVFYPDTNLHIHELWSDSSGAWHDHDVTAASGAPVAYSFVGYGLYALTSFYWPNSSSPGHVFFGTGPSSTVGTNPPVGDIHELWSDSSGNWHDRDITALTGAPQGGGPSSSFLWPNSSAPEHIFYSTVDGHIHELWSDSSGGWHHQDITVLSGAPAAGGGVGSLTTSLLSIDPNAPEHVYFTDATSHVWGIWTDTNGAWHKQDTTSLIGASPGTAFTSFTDVNGDHVFVESDSGISHFYNGILTASQLASALINDPNSGLNIPNSPVRATLSGATITLIAVEGGANSNLPLQGSSTFDSADFTAPSFAESTPTSLTGGQDAIATPLYDSGTLSVTINNRPSRIEWSEGATPQGLATALAKAINQDVGASVTAVPTGNVVTFTSKTSGANTTYSIAPGLTFNSTDFGQASFSVQASSPTLLGGQDANAPVYDTGTLTISINGYSKQFPYGPGIAFSPAVFAVPFNTDPNSPVWAIPGPGTVNFTAKKPGQSTNYPFSVTSVTNNPAFTGTSFPVLTSGATLIQGADNGPQTTACDAGVISFSVGSFTISPGYGEQNCGGVGTGLGFLCCSATDIASALGNAINQSSNAPVIAAVNGSQITLAAKTGGAASNVPFSITTQNANPGLFPTPSFSFNASSGSLTGGADPPSPSSPSASTAVVAFSVVSGSISAPDCFAYYLLVVNGEPYKTCLTNTPLDSAKVAGLVAQTVNDGDSAPVKATAIGDVLYLQSKFLGSKTNYIVDSYVVVKDAVIMSVAVSGPTMTGGTGPASDGTVYALDLGTDASGTVFQSNDSVNGNWTYQYDYLNRINQAATATNTYTYDYDRFGNRLHQTPSNGGNSLSLTYINNQIQAKGVGFDASGNMTSDGNHTYAYDAENRLISIDGGQTATYTYGADGLRVRSSVGSTITDFVYHLDGQVAGVFGANGTLIRQEIGGLATYSDVAYFHQRDWLGNLRLVTDQTGAVRQTCTNLPYGDGLTCTSAGPTPTYFTGYMRDAESGLGGLGGLDYANARYYTSQYGRFMSVDPLSGDISDPQSLNPYAYVGNSPLSATDSSGMAIDLPLIFSGNPAAGGGSGGGSGLLSIFGISGAYTPPVIGPFFFSGFSFGGFGGGGASGNNGGFGDAPVPGSLGLCFVFAGCGFDSRPAGPSASQVRAEGAFNSAPGAGTQSSKPWWWDAAHAIGFFYAGNHGLDPNSTLGWTWNFTKGLFSWQEFGMAQIDAQNKGYYSCLGNKMIPFKGLIAAAVAKGAEETATNAAKRYGGKLAGAYYHFTDGRFTAWGKYSRVLVPEAAEIIGKVAKGVSIAGWGLTDIEGGHAIYECSKLLTGKH
jgi:RHS repeat-associated protein